MRAIFFGDVPHRMAGAQRSLLAALRHVADLGLDPTVVFPGEGLFADACREAGLRVRVLPAPPSFHSFGRALTRIGVASQVGVMATELVPYAVRLARLIDAERADVVHYNTARGVIMAGLGARLAGRGAVLHLRGAPAFGRRYWLAAQALSDSFILVARALERDLLPSARARSRVVYNGVNVPPPLDRREARRLLRESLGPGAPALEDDALVVVSLSSPVPFKGLHHLLTAAADARRRGVQATYLLAGAGLGDAYELWLRRRAADLGLAGSAHFLGFLDNTRALLGAADVLALPSVEHEELRYDDARVDVRGTEGLPRSILEAMAAGLPVVATRVAGVEEQVEDGVTGLLVPPSDPGQLADALVRAAHDPAWRRAAGERARQVVQHRFSVRAAAQGLCDALALAASSRRIDRSLDVPRLCRDIFLQWRVDKSLEAG